MERPRSRRRVLLASGAALSVALAGCTDGSMTDEQPAGPDNETETAGDDEATDGGMGEGADDAQIVTVGPDGDPVFDPDQVQVQRGGTVRWEWASSGHTVTPTSVPEGVGWTGTSEPQDEGHTYEHRFQVVGTYEYQCDPHAEDGMVGAVVVEE